MSKSRKLITTPDEGVYKADIVDDLTSIDTDKPLSANQGKQLEDKKANISGGNDLSGRQKITTSELVTNGDFDSDVSGWSTLDCTITWDNGTALVEYSADTQYVYQSVPLEAGKTYILSAEIQESTGRKFYIGFDDNLGSPILNKDKESGQEYISVAFTPTTSQNYNVIIYSEMLSGGSYVIDNISLREIPLNVYGGILLNSKNDEILDPSVIKNKADRYGGNEFDGTQTITGGHIVLDRTGDSVTALLDIDTDSNAHAMIRLKQDGVDMWRLVSEPNEDFTIDTGAGEERFRITSAGIVHFLNSISFDGGNTLFDDSNIARKDVGQTFSGEQTFTGKIISETTIRGDTFSTIDDDTAIVATGETIGILLIGARNDTYKNVSGLVVYRNSSNIHATVMAQPDTKLVGDTISGVPTGTSGTDGDVTIFASDDGNTYLENRNGGAIAVSILNFGY